jgi:hypothetical protein
MLLIKMEMRPPASRVLQSREADLGSKMCLDLLAHQFVTLKSVLSNICDDLVCDFYVRMFSCPMRFPHCLRCLAGVELPLRSFCCAGDPTRAMAGEAGGEAKAIAIMKNGAALLLGGSRPEGRRKCSMLPKSLDPDVSNNNSLAHAQQPVSTHRPKLFFGQLSSYQTRSRACPRRRRHASGAPQCPGRALCRCGSVGPRDGTTTRVLVALRRGTRRADRSGAI